MKKRKLLYIILSIALVFASSSLSFAAQSSNSGTAKAAAKAAVVPTDVAGTQYEKAVSDLMALGVIAGYEDGTYQPENPVTRAELAKMIVTALGMDDSGIAVYAGLSADVLTDVGKNWAKDYIGYVQHIGIITGYPDQTFQPKSAVSYDEAITIILRALGYTDQSLTGKWPANYRQKAVELGIVKEGITGKDSVSRGNLALMFEQAVDIAIGKTDDKGTFTAAKDDTMRARLTAAAEETQQGKIPYGFRLLHEYELGGAVADSTANIPNSSYYETPDFYNLTSSDTLTMLTHFKTTQQMTDWSCGPTSALMVLEWYDMRGELNEMDLGAMRGKKPGGATTLKGMLSIFDGLEKNLGQKWDLVSTYDLKEDPESGALTLEVEKGKVLPLEETIPYYLEKGEPIIVGSQDWAGHYQVIIGYDTMGTEVTQDDVLILADPYDTTDHMQDGYIVQAYERFIYDWSAEFDPDFDACIFLVAVPEGYQYDGPIEGAGLKADTNNKGDFSSPQVIPYTNQLKTKLAALAKDYNSPIEIGENGLSGPADSAYYRQGDHDQSPYYKMINAYTMKETANRQLLEKFKTTQQTTEYTCGVSSMLMTLEWFDKLGALDEMDLTALRDKKDDLPGTTVQEMLNIISHLNGKWNVVSSLDMVEGDSDLGYGINIDGKYVDLAEMIPYYLEKDIPIMIMWHEWGGHWQVIIGYDNMGTEATQDDVLILADPYDTTDHNQDGYLVESYERFIYDWGNSYDEKVPWGGFVVMNPAA